MATKKKTATAAKKTAVKQKEDQQEPAAAPAEDTVATSTENSGTEPVTVVVAPDPPAPEPGKTTEEPKAAAPAKVAALPPRAAAFVRKVLQSYFGKNDLKAAVEASVLDAILDGKQPVIRKGEGNTRFVLDISKLSFAKGDPAQDVGGAGVLVNIARSLADSGLYRA